MRFVPTEGRVIIHQSKQKKSSSGILFIPSEAVEADHYAEIVACKDEELVGKRVFFDVGFATVISDTEEDRYSVLDIDNILCFVEEE